MNEPNAPVDPDTATLARLTALSRALRLAEANYTNLARDTRNAKAKLASAKKAQDDFVAGLSTPLPLFDGPEPSGEVVVPVPPAHRDDLWRATVLDGIGLEDRIAELLSGAGLETAGDLDDWESRPGSGGLEGIPGVHAPEAKAIAAALRAAWNRRVQDQAAAAFERVNGPLPDDVIACGACHHRRPRDQHPCPECGSPEYRVNPETPEERASRPKGKRSRSGTKAGA